MVIYKYPIAITDSQAVLMPKNAKILSVQFQRETLCLWALVDPEEEKHAREIFIFGTGVHASFHMARFIGTVPQFGGSLVWHVFEKLSLR